jgi:hypothetical protein
LVDEGREEVPFEVIDPEKWSPARAGHALGGGAADEQGRGEAGSVRRGKGVDLRHFD